MITILNNVKIIIIFYIMANSETLEITEKLQYELKINFSIEYTEGELLAKCSLYPNILYTPVIQPSLETISKIFSKRNSQINVQKIQFQSFKETNNPILLIENTDTNEKFELKLKRILSKEELIERLNSLNNCQSENNLFKFQSIFTKYKNLKNNSEEKIKQLENNNQQQENTFNSNFLKITSELEETNLNLQEIKKKNEVLNEKELEILEKLKDSKNPNILKNILKKEKDKLKYAFEPTREFTELDTLYGELPGEDYVCKGINNGCTISTVYGSNPYTTDSKYCSAALHSGLIDENGGFFHVKNIGNLNNYVGSSNKGVTTNSWNSAWGGLSFHYSDITLDTNQKINGCGLYKNNVC